jgi:hypothetical protein
MVVYMNGKTSDYLLGMIAYYSCFSAANNDETWQANYRAKPASFDTQTEQQQHG